MQSQNLNIRSAVVYAIGDLIQSIGVIVAAIIIVIEPKYKIIDPICTYIFSVLVLFTTVPVCRDCLNILMEFTPREINITELQKELLNIDGVIECRDFKVWAISGGKNFMTAHLKLDK